MKKKNKYISFFPLSFCRKENKIYAQLFNFLFTKVRTHTHSKHIFSHSNLNVSLLHSHSLSITNKSKILFYFILFFLRCSWTSMMALMARLWEIDFAIEKKWKFSPFLRLQTPRKEKSFLLYIKRANERASE
jgi:hypothetical protein